MRERETMETERPKWAEINAENQKFFSPETGKSYRIAISGVELQRKAFREGDKPKLKAVCSLSAIDGVPTTKVWETGSFSVMNELKKSIRDEKWMGSHITFLLKKKKEGEKVSYVFEDLGALEASP